MTFSPSNLNGKLKIRAHSALNDEYIARWLMTRQPA